MNDTNQKHLLEFRFELKRNKNLNRKNERIRATLD